MSKTVFVPTIKDTELAEGHMKPSALKASLSCWFGKASQKPHNTPSPATNVYQAKVQATSFAAAPQQ